MMSLYKILHNWSPFCKNKANKKIIIIIKYLGRFDLIQIKQRADWCNLQAEENSYA